MHLLITKLNLKTPGREDEKEVKLYSKADYKEKKEKETRATVFNCSSVVFVSILKMQCNSLLSCYLKAP